MPGQYLLITPEIKENISKMVSHAEKYILSSEDLKRSYSEVTVSEIKPFTCKIPPGYRVIFTIEQQTKGLFRHLNVAMDTPYKLPAIEAMQEIMSLTGFKTKEYEVVLEKWAPGVSSLSVYEKM